MERRREHFADGEEEGRKRHDANKGDCEFSARGIETGRNERHDPRCKQYDHSDEQGEHDDEGVEHGTGECPRGGGVIAGKHLAIERDVRGTQRAARKEQESQIR